MWECTLHLFWAILLSNNKGSTEQLWFDVIRVLETCSIQMLQYGQWYIVSLSTGLLQSVAFHKGSIVYSFMLVIEYIVDHYQYSISQSGSYVCTYVCMYGWMYVCMDEGLSSSYTWIHWIHFNMFNAHPQTSSYNYNMYLSLPLRGGMLAASAKRGWSPTAAGFNYRCYRLIHLTNRESYIFFTFNFTHRGNGKTYL